MYTSATPSLAALEVLVHVDPGLAPGDLRLIEMDVPDDVDVEMCNPAEVSANWKAFPSPVALQDFGSTWLAELRTPLLSVPSAVLDIERNVLLNPAHPDASRMRIVAEHPFSFDPRLVEP